jgi:hypothetical protein
VSAEAAINDGRAAAEALMVDTCVIFMPAASSTFDPITGTNTAAPSSVVYQGPCRLQIQQPQPYTPDGGGHRFTVEQFILQLPVSAVTPPIGARVQVVSSFDDGNDARVFSVISTFRKSHATCQRLQMVEVAE